MTQISGVRDNNGLFIDIENCWVIVPGCNAGRKYRGDDMNVSPVAQDKAGVGGEVSIHSGSSSEAVVKKTSFGMSVQAIEVLSEDLTEGAMAAGHRTRFSPAISQGFEGRGVVCASENYVVFNEIWKKHFAGKETSSSLKELVHSGHFESKGYVDQEQLKIVFEDVVRLAALFGDRINDRNKENIAKQYLSMLEEVSTQEGFDSTCRYIRKNVEFFDHIQDSEREWKCGFGGVEDYFNRSLHIWNKKISRSTKYVQVWKRRVIDAFSEHAKDQFSNLATKFNQRFKTNVYRKPLVPVIKFFDLFQRAGVVKGDSACFIGEAPGSSAFLYDCVVGEDWIASSPQIGEKGEKAFFADDLLMRNHPNWVTDVTGDVYDEDFIKRLKTEERFHKKWLISDIGIPGALKLEQIVLLGAILSAFSPGFPRYGCILKTYNLLTPGSEKVVCDLISQFDEYEVVKPVGSRWDSSEVYLVCKGRRVEPRILNEEEIRKIKSSFHEIYFRHKNFIESFHNMESDLRVPSDSRRLGKEFIDVVSSSVAGEEADA